MQRPAEQDSVRRSRYIAARQRRRATGPQPPGPARTGPVVLYVVHVRNTSGGGRGTWAALVTQMREAAGLTKTELGRRLGVDRATVMRWEENKNRPTDPGVVYAFAELFALDIDETLAAAGLRRPPTERPAPAAEPDPVIEAVLASPLPNRKKQALIERIYAQRAQQAEREMADVQWLIEQESA